MARPCADGVRPKMTHPALPAALAETLAARGYESLTPVQEEMLREDLAGADMIVSIFRGIFSAFSKV